MDETLKGLREERARLIAQADEILTQADRRDGKRLTSEDETKYDAMYRDIEKLTSEISLREKHEALQRSVADSQYAKKELESSKTEEGRQARSESAEFRRWAATGERASLSEGDLAACRAHGVQATNQVWVPESRAMATTSATNGAKAIPQGFMANLEVAMLDFGDVRRVARVVRTASGNTMLWPTSNDTGNTGALLAENTAAATQDVAISNVQFDAYKYSSKAVLVSVELLQDEAVDLEAMIGAMLGERLGRIGNTHQTTGTGSSQPNGVVTASTLGKTAAGTAAITYGELVDLQHSVDPAYQRNARWMFNFSTLAALKKLVDSEGRPIWQPSMSAGMGEFPATLFGKPYEINQDMASLATGNKTVLYGDFSKYVVREVKDTTLLRLAERYADQHSVGFLAFMRMDADLLNAGTNPIKHLIQA